jgi:hypothetical protein
MLRRSPLFRLLPLLGRGALCIGFGALAQPAATSTQGGKEAVRIRIELDGTSLTATLDDSQAAQAFAAQLPLSVSLKDYASTEKIADLPKKLSTQGSAPGYEPRAGDIAYYAPWGNLAIFYKGFSYSTGLVRLGKIDGDVQALERPGPLPATFRLQ